MTGELVHSFTAYYRPSFQGGDTQQPLCCKPRFGWNEQGAHWPMTAMAADVTCPLCRKVLRRPRIVQAEAPEPVRYEAPKPRRNNDLKHCMAVLRASGGQMFPFGREFEKARAA